MKKVWRSPGRGLMTPCVALGVSLLVGSLDVCSAAGAAKPGMTWDSIKTLPDLGGWWELASLLPASPPLKPDVARENAAAVARMRKAIADGTDPAELGLGRSYCKPQVYQGTNNSDINDLFEILLTPGRATIANELGLVRRIALDAGPLPEKPAPSNAGTSIGHWEGQVMVVETVGLKPNAGLYSLTPAVHIGRDVRVVERISLAEPDVLSIETRLTAPEILTVPWEYTLRYHRNSAHVFQEIDNCADNRAFDNTTGREKFDMTPPHDLPPPPSGPVPGKGPT